jgi:hypothetical protein
VQYGTGVILFLLVVVGGPIAYHIFTIPPTCTDGIQNQGETAIDKGGPCPILDEKALSPASVVWTRSFRVRDGTYNSVAMLQNPNGQAGVRSIGYHFGLYDQNNVLIAERDGTTFIMPGGVTPVFEGTIDTGNRIVAHTYFDFTETPVWERLQDTSGIIALTNIEIANTTSEPRVTAQAKNTSVSDTGDFAFVTIIYDPAGNAFAASRTTVSALAAGKSRELIFTWPDPFNVSVGRIQITPLSMPASPAAY